MFTKIEPGNPPAAWLSVRTSDRRLDVIPADGDDLSRRLSDLREYARAVLRANGVDPDNPSIVNSSLHYPVRSDAERAARDGRMRVVSEALDVLRLCELLGFLTDDPAPNELAELDARHAKVMDLRWRIEIAEPSEDRDRLTKQLGEHLAQFREVPPWRRDLLHAVTTALKLGMVAARLRTLPYDPMVDSALAAEDAQKRRLRAAGEKARAIAERGYPEPLRPAVARILKKTPLIGASAGARELRELGFKQSDKHLQTLFRREKKALLLPGA